LNEDEDALCTWEQVGDLCTVRSKASVDRILHRSKYWKLVLSSDTFSALLILLSFFALCFFCSTYRHLGSMIFLDGRYAYESEINGKLCVVIAVAPALVSRCHRNCHVERRSAIW